MGSILAAHRLLNCGKFRDRPGRYSKLIKRELSIKIKLGEQK